MTSTDEDNTEEKDEEEEHPHFGNMSHSFFPRVPRLFPRLFDRLVSKNNQQSKFPSQHHNGTVWPVHDLLANELLLWLLPTHMVTHLIKFGVIFIGLLLGFLWSLLQKDTNTLILSNALEDGKGSEYGWACWTFGISLVLWIYYSYHTTLYAIGKPWMDPRITSVNRMEMHVPLRLFTSTESARRAACLPEMVCRASADDPGPHTPNVYNLDSATEWKFQLLPTVEQALDFVYQQKDADSSANTKQWTSIPVPSNWMLFPNVPDIPIYTNQKYPFPCTPPIVPRDNPTGIYQRQIALPADWDTSFSSSDSSNTYSILLQGFESMAWVFWNGAFLGCAKDSRLPSEFQIPSEFCSDYNENSKFCTITIVVCRWSDGSYVEDQDHWWMAGLHRSVELVQRSVVADIMDYRVDATALGEINVKVQLRNSASGGSGSGSGSGIGRYIVSSEQDSSSTRTITARLYADEQLTAEGDWNMASQELWSESISITNVSNAVNKEYTSLVELQTILPNVKLWTAETPNLYTLVLEQSQSDGDDQAAVITQVESCRVGFRTIDIEKGVLRVNGKRIMVCGINRHEHDPDHGKVVSLERMKQDITVLK
jgi:beta-galactosidase